MRLLYPSTLIDATSGDTQYMSNTAFTSTVTTQNTYPNNSKVDWAYDILYRKASVKGEEKELRMKFKFSHCVLRLAVSGIIIAVLSACAADGGVDSSIDDELVKRNISEVLERDIVLGKDVSQLFKGKIGGILSSARISNMIPGGSGSSIYNYLGEHGLAVPIGSVVRIDVDEKLQAENGASVEILILFKNSVFIYEHSLVEEFKQNPRNFVILGWYFINDNKFKILLTDEFPVSQIEMKPIWPTRN